MDARVIAVVSSEDKAEVARAAGAHHVVRSDEFLTQAKELTDGRGVDIVVDPVGGDRFTDSLRSLAPEGRLLVVGFTAGQIPEVKVNRLLLNNLSVVGVGWGAYWTPNPDYLQEQWAAILPLLEAGLIAAPIGARHPLDDVAAALSEIDERRALGKVTLTVR
jgi:NADPH2:quinone reductase